MQDGAKKHEVAAQHNWLSRYRLVYRCKYIAIGTKYKDIYRYIYGDDVWTRSERTPEDVISTVRPLLLRDLRRVEKQEKGREREEDKERRRDERRRRKDEKRSRKRKDSEI